jgi:NADH-quinone oxidoreductase subunit L
VHFSHLPAAGFAHFAVLAGVFVTAFYSFRMYFLVFHGKERFDQNPDAHHDDHGHHGHDDHHGHHAARVALGGDGALVLLAIPSVVIGFMTIQPMLFGDFFKDAIFVNAPAPGHGRAGQHLPRPGGDGLHALTTAPFWLAVAGVALSYYMYMVNPRCLPPSSARAAALHLA